MRKDPQGGQKPRHGVLNVSSTCAWANVPSCTTQGFIIGTTSNSRNYLASLQDSLATRLEHQELLQTLSKTSATVNFIFTFIILTNSIIVKKINVTMEKIMEVY